MVTHIVIFTWKAGTTAAQTTALQAALDCLASELTGLATITHGPNLRFREGNGDYALVATFPDQAAWQAYQADPRHKAFVQEMVTPIQASRLTIQF